MAHQFHSAALKSAVPKHISPTGNSAKPWTPCICLPVRYPLPPSSYPPHRPPSPASGFHGSAVPRGCAEKRCAKTHLAAHFAPLFRNPSTRIRHRHPHRPRPDGPLVGRTERSEIDRSVATCPQGGRGGGHQTTMIYLHVMKRPGAGAPSPLDSAL